MKAKNVVLNGANVEATEADREILSNYLSRYELLEFPKDEKAYTLADEDFFEIEVTLLGTTYQLELFPYELRTDDYQGAVDGKIVEETRSPCRTFRGTVKNTDNMVRLLFTENGISGFIQLDDQKLFVHPSTKFNIKNSKPTLFVVYYGGDMLIKDDFYCGVTSEDEKRFLDTLPNNPPSHLTSSECMVLKIATDADFAYFQNQGSSIINTNNEILNIINQIEDVYSDTFDIALRVTFQNVWTTTDPYVGNDPTNNSESSDFLDSFRDYWEINFTHVVRDVAHLFTGINPSTSPYVAGVAYLGSICANPSESYSYTVERPMDYLTTAHEIGHNFGGIHGDGVNCGTTSASLMCQGYKQDDPMYFSPASITRMSNFINANNLCLNPALFYKILGNTLLCSSENYTISHLLSTVTTVWSVSPSSAATISGVGSTRTLTRSPSYNGPFTLTVAIDTNCGAISIFRNLYAGLPMGATVDGMTPVSKNTNNTYIAVNVPIQAEAVSYGGFVIPKPSTGATGGTITPTHPGVVTISFATAGEYEVGVNITTPCGWTESSKLTVEVI